MKSIKNNFFYKMVQNFLHSENIFVKIIRAISPYAAMVVVALLVIWICNDVYPISFVSGPSMNPTIKNGSIVTCSKTLQPIERGDIFVFVHSKKRFIKRLVAVPGDTISIKDGKLYVNGEISPYNFEDIQKENEGLLSGIELHLYENEYYFMGDNRNNSNDCRDFGPVFSNQIIFKVKKILF